MLDLKWKIKNKKNKEENKAWEDVYIFIYYTF